MIVLIVALFVALPLIVFRGGTLRRWFAFDLASWAFALAVWKLGPAIDGRVALISFAVAKLAAFSIALAAGREVRWSANRAALIAAIVYAAVIPTQMQSAIDGDEPFYLLITESIVHDFDLDLANQYRNLGQSKTGRIDLKAQEGDPTGARGEQYSRHAPFLPMLLIPGYLLAGLPGALATMAIFGVLLVRSTMRLLEDEGISDAAARALFPLFALAPPVIFYAARIWPEVPGALCFVEALRGVRNRRMQRWLPAMLALVLLKLRFALIAVVLLVSMWRRRLGGVLLVLAIPIAFLWTTTVHSWRELLPSSPRAYAIGLFGLLTDGAAGFLFQAPIYLLGIFAITRWKSMPEGFRLGMLASVLYVITLLPRTEWHGGWSPPLRYVVVFTPVLILGVAAMWKRSYVALASIWTIGLVAHGLLFPWRLFHIADGENAMGEWLSELYAADFSRMFPSFIRVNDAAWIAALAISVAFVFFGLRWRSHRFQSGSVAAAVQTLLLALWFLHAQKPSDTIHFEDAHVTHTGGELYPHEYAVARWYYRGGWIVAQGDQLSFLAQPGRYTLDYAAQPGTRLEIAGKAIDLPPTGLSYSTIAIDIPRGGRVLIRCLSGRANLDRMIHE